LSKFLPNDQWPPGIDPGGHRFWRQHMAFNKSPIFNSEQVINDPLKVS
jgi:hypothetical protein